MSCGLAEAECVFVVDRYQQLVANLRNRDDATIRSLATTLEMEVCRRSPTRAEYVAGLNQEVHRLMQREVANNATSSQVLQPNQHANTGVPGGTPGGQITPPFGNNQAVSRGMGYSQQNPTANVNMPAEGSFMQSLLSSQAPMGSFDQSRSLQQGAPMAGQATSHQPSKATYTAPYGATSQAQPSATTQAAYHQQQQSMNQQMMQQQFGSQQPVVQQNPMAAFQEFVTKVQHCEKNQLVELLWNQRNATIQAQRRVMQLEAQLTALRQGTVGSMPGATQGFYNASPRTSGFESVPPSLSQEAELRRAADRQTHRGPQQSIPQGYNPHPSQPTPYNPMATGSQMQATGMPPTQQQSGSGFVSPAQYWEKVNNLRSLHMQSLMIAHKALSQHTAPPNSSQGIKAETVKHNINLAMSVLSEVPKPNVQLRPYEVLESIEKFILSTVVPIVRKVQSGITPSGSSTPTNSTNQLGAIQSGGRPGQAPVAQAPVAQQPTRNGTPVHGPPDSSPNTQNRSHHLDGSASATQEKPSPSVGKETTTYKPSQKASSNQASAIPQEKQSHVMEKDTSRERAPTQSHTPASQSRSSIEQAASSDGKGEQPTMHAGPASHDKARADGSNEVSEVEGSKPEQPKQVPSLTNVNKQDGVEEDDLNFADFPELDFGDDLQDSISKVADDKENTSAHNAKKRPFGDV